MKDKDAAESLAGGRLLRIRRGPILEIRLHRPEVHNALDEELIAGLTEAFHEIARSENGLRGVLLSAEGKSFCAGADLNYMARMAGYTEDENREDARRLAGMFHAIRSCPVFVLGRIQGAALGGGSGMVACCDLNIAAETARFGFTEVRLGIIPATISPYVLDRIGPAHGRALFPTGEIFDAPEARRVGLIDRVVAKDELDASVRAVLEQLLSAAPQASRLAKRLVGWISRSLPLELGAEDAGLAFVPDAGSGRSMAEISERTAQSIAQLRASAEGREGMAAFLQKRKPSWVARIPGPGEDG